MGRAFRVGLTAGVVLLGLMAAVAGLYLYSSRWENGLFHRPLSRLDTAERVVALTFDDGPSQERTPALLDLLGDRQVKATFFMLGQAIERHPAIAKRVFQEGHLIGNHSYDHAKLVFQSPAFIERQITRTDPPAEYRTPFVAEQVAREVIEAVGPGSIVYLHDGKDSENAAFLTAVDLVIQGLRDRGYRFVRLDE